jgi:hypothetical protein
MKKTRKKNRHNLTQGKNTKDLRGSVFGLHLRAIDDEFTISKRYYKVFTMTRHYFFDNK